MIVLVCGSRNWEDSNIIEEQMSNFPSSTIVIHGGAKGADSDCAFFCRQLGIHTAEVLPIWNKYGKFAGPKRNFAMLDLKPDKVLAFSNGTKGTQSTINEARRRGIETIIFGKEI